MRDSGTRAAARRARDPVTAPPVVPPSVPALPADLIARYQAGEITTREIADSLGYTADHVRRLMRRQGVADNNLRSRRPGAGQKSPGHPTGWLVVQLRPHEERRLAQKAAECGRSVTDLVIGTLREAGII